MLRPPSKDEEWKARLHGSPPEGWLAVPDAKTDDERVGARELTIEEISHVESLRRRPKNSLGQSEESATTSIRREAAVQAILYTPPAKVSKEEVKARAVNLVEYKSIPLTEEWVPMTWYQAFWHRIKGNKVRSEIK